MDSKCGVSREDEVSDRLDMPPDVSLRLFKEGATFVFLDVPVGTEIGIDMESWNTGEKFRGIKMIPPGLHFVYFSAVSKDYQNTAPRTGFYHIFNKQELLVKKYDRKLEDISAQDIPSDAQSVMKDRMEEMDRFLGVYPYKLWRTWVSLTNRITNETLERLSPPNGRILSAPELTLDKDQSVPQAPKRKMTKLEEAEQSLPKMTENLESKIRYTAIPTDTYPDGSTPQEISKFQLDKTWKLNQVIELIGKPTDYLAELQFAFVTFLVGQHYDSFEHWKSMVYLVCHSDDAILKYPALYFDFVSDIYFQIKEVPEDFFVDIVASNNFLFNCLHRLINNVKDQDTAETKLRNKVERFSTFLTSKFGWDLGEDEFDDAPTIVDEAEAIISTHKESPPAEEEEEDHEDDVEFEAMDVVGDMPMF